MLFGISQHLDTPFWRTGRSMCGCNLTSPSWMGSLVAAPRSLRSGSPRTMWLGKMRTLPTARWPEASLDCEIEADIHRRHQSRNRRALAPTPGHARRQPPRPHRPAARLGHRPGRPAAAHLPAAAHAARGLADLRGPLFAATLTICTGHVATWRAWRSPSVVRPPLHAQGPAHNNARGSQPRA